MREGRGPGADRGRRPRHDEAGIIATSSSASGQRPACFFEKMSFPSSTTSSTPPEPGMSVASMPRAFLISAARPAARAR